MDLSVIFRHSISIVVQIANNTVGRLMVKQFIALLCALCAPQTLVAGTQDPRFYLTTQDKQGIPRYHFDSRFDCREKIYGVLEYSNLSIGKHRFSVLWRDPSGQKRENPSYKFPVIKQINSPSQLSGATTHRSRRVWVWIKVHHPTSGEEFGVLQPNFGRDRNLGTWSATAYLDGDRVGLMEFTMLCF